MSDYTPSTDEVGDAYIQMRVRESGASTPDERILASADALPEWERWLAGHEAATRTRVVTTVAELDALADRTCIIDADMEFHQRHGSLLDRTVESAWLGFLSPTLRAASEIRLPARVLYEPKDTGGRVEKESA
jgi:hypothetical protein